MLHHEISYTLFNDIENDRHVYFFIDSMFDFFIHSAIVTNYALDSSLK